MARSASKDEGRDDYGPHEEKVKKILIWFLSMST